MKLKVFSVAAAALALTATPVVAQANLLQRAPAQTDQAEKAGQNNGMIIALGAALVVIAGLVVISSGGSDEPTSP